MAKQIHGKVASVLNEREIAINVGTTDGVIVDMLFDVMDPRYSNIKDPDTEEVLGSIERSKVRVKVIEVQDKLSLATTFRTEEVQIGPRVSDFAVPSGGWITKSETLKIGGKLGDAPDDLEESQSYVKTGDPVIQVIEAIDTEGDAPVENTKSSTPALDRLLKMDV